VVLFYFHALLFPFVSALLCKSKGEGETPDHQG